MKPLPTEKPLDCLPRSFPVQEWPRGRVAAPACQAGQSFGGHVPGLPAPQLLPGAAADQGRGLHQVGAGNARHRNPHRRGGRACRLTRPIRGYFPSTTKKCEMLVVVCPGFQNLASAPSWSEAAWTWPANSASGRIWLPVDATNVRARHVYQKCGFAYVSNQPGANWTWSAHVANRCAPCGPTPLKPLCPIISCRVCRI